MSGVSTTPVSSTPVSSTPASSSEYKDIAARYATAKVDKEREEREWRGNGRLGVQQERSGEARRYAEARFTVTQGLLVGFLGLLV